MGRPREHDEKTRAALRSAAERIVADGGYGALSVRAVADEADTSTRAVYSVFGSKEGLVDALAQTAFAFLYAQIDALPETGDPVADLVEACVHSLRSLVLEHPALYRIAFQRVVPGFRASRELTAARQLAWEQLQGKIRRVEARGWLGQTSVDEATVACVAVSEGLANAELRGVTLPTLPEGDTEDAWRRALTTMIRGFAVSRTGESA